MDKVNEHIEVTDLIDEFEHEQEIESIEKEISEIDKKLQNMKIKKKEEDGK